MSKPVIRTRDRGHCFIGEVEVPVQGGRMTFRQVGAFPWDAVKRATSVALRVATDPALAPFMPPGVLPAIQAGRKVAAMAQTNPALLHRIAPQLTPANRKLATSFLRRMPAAQRMPLPEHRVPYRVPPKEDAPPPRQPESTDDQYFEEYEDQYAEDRGDEPEMPAVEE